MNLLELKFRWTYVQSSLGCNYVFPADVSAYIRDQYCQPSVYRWFAWTPPGNLNALYIGETENLARRIQHYLRPGPRQVTNIRLKKYFDEATNKGQRIELQVLEFDPFQINQVSVSMDLLGSTHVRRMLENLILVLLKPSADSGPPVILNQVFAQDIERNKRREDEAIAALGALGLRYEEIKRIIEKVQVRKSKI